MPRVVHFEISADDPQRAIAFYTNVFGWNIQKWAGSQEYWLVNTGGQDKPGINGGLFVRKGPVGYVNTIDVVSADEWAAKIASQGGDVVVPKMAIPGVGYLVYCKDTEGNIFGIMHEDASAR